MAERNDANWIANYTALQMCVFAHGHFPDRHRVESIGLLNWWKYNAKKRKAGILTEEQMQMLDELSALRSGEHTGGRKKAIRKTASK